MATSRQAGSGGARGSRLTPWSPRLLAWQAWHLVTSTFTLRGRRSSIALGDLHVHFARQAWHLWHWAGSALGDMDVHSAWQAWHLCGTGLPLVLCSSQPARDWKSCFSFFPFFILIIIFWLENYHSLFIPVKFFHYFFIPVFPPFGIFIFLSFASKMVLGPWELPPEAFSRTLFVCFSIAFAL